MASLTFWTAVMRRNPFGVDICCRKGSRSPLQELYNPTQGFKATHGQRTILAVILNAGESALTDVPSPARSLKAMSTDISTDIRTSCRSRA
ncbi:Carbohydrate sulfotransferase 11 [Myotis davidii]|uniref:Carbohydrate sulfotransferase 11 n=1 Tax=Myotis davidii TaxID=225400 RepID=L5LIX5_MYODS|nr:Carbohydrate sulfotransferase 11 [Myotis davidii]